jgi:formylglycine-generating enzyme required for sulfatase activity
VDPAAPGLHALRWETLYDLDQRLALCADENLLFSRALSSASLETFQPPPAGRLRALVVIANPQARALEPIDVAGELARARAGLAEMDLTVLASGGAATLEALLGGLHEGCDVLYLVAHGLRKDPPLLFLENPDGSPDPVEADRLFERLRGVADLPLLAVLVSCESAGGGGGGGGAIGNGATGSGGTGSGGTGSGAIGSGGGGGGQPAGPDPFMAIGPRLLVETGIPAVLAMHGKVTMRTMETFLPVFFRELARDGVIDRALAVARARVLDRPDWWMPVLFSRLHDNRLLQPQSMARPFERLRFEPETVFVPAGPFWMGSDLETARAWERPRHQVNLPAYRIGRAPVTNRQFAEFLRAAGRRVNDESGWVGQNPPPDRLDSAVLAVSWYQALEYCAWLSTQTGRRYTLPGEAHWEKAARGPDGRRFPWGDDWPPPGDLADPAVLESPYGLRATFAGAREWTATLWGESRREPQYRYPYQADEREDCAAHKLVLRVVRGGPLAPGAAGGGAQPTTDLAAREGALPESVGSPRARHTFRVVMLEDGSNPV